MKEMKKQLLFVVSIVLTATFYAQNIPSYVPTNGLVGWWPFNGNANDESGNGNHGTVYGATLIKDRKGVANSAYSFNNNYIEIKPISKYNGMQDFTISTWVKLYANSSADVNYLICRGQDAGGNLYLGHKNATYIFPGGGGAVSKQHTYINVWNQITISRKDSVVSVFVNGELDSTFKNAQLYSTNNENLYFGVHKWLTQLTGYYPYYLQGELDDIAIYNRALTQLEINSFYEEKIVTLPNYISKNGLVGYWPFNGNANDESGNGNHGTVNGATLTKDRNGISNSAYSFNNNYIEIKPISMYNGMQDFTISTWVKLYANSSADVNYLICRGQDAGGNLYLGHKNATYIFPGGGGAVSKQHTYINVWNQITISRKDSVVSVFVNGELDSTFKNAQLYSTNNENLYFGVHKWLTQLTGYYPYYLQGELDDITIYNRGLTQLEIKSLYTGNLNLQNIPSYVPTNGLIGYWPFNGNANDESGNGNHGKVNGATLVSDRNGNVNTAYSFDGNNDYIDLGKWENGGTFTISVWVNYSKFQNNSRLLDFGNGENVNNIVIYNRGKSNYLTYYSTSMKSDLTSDIYIDNFFSTNNWTNLIITLDSNKNIKLYRNNILIDSKFINHLPEKIFRSNQYFGKSNWQIDEYLAGKLDDIAIYNRALTQEEITALYLGDCTKPLAAITPKSTTNIKENESVVLAATKGNGYTYAWYKDGIAIANATDSNYTATLPGVYTVKVTSTACDSTSVGVTVKRVYALPNYLPTNGLVGWWPFNGNANDESGNENHGTVNGATLTSDKNGAANKAYSFDGVDDFLLIPSDVSDFSISLWYNFSAPSNQFSELFYFEDFSASIVQNGNYIYIRKQNQIISSIDLSTSQIINNQWNHIVVKYNSVQNTIECVLNNIEFFSSSITSGGLPNLINDNMFQIAGRQFNNTNFFNGQFDDISIWNRALTQEEITALYLGEACTTPIATITPQTATSFCSGGSVNLNAATNANYTYQWLNNGTPISAATTATYKATTSGKYSVIVKNNSGCIDTSSVVTVNVSATPSLPILTGPATLCYNSKAIFKASIAGGTWGVANDYLLISSPQGLFRNNKMPPSNLYKTGVTYTLKSKDKLCSVTAQKSVWIRNVAATSVTLTASKQTLKVGEEVAATATTKISGNALFWMSASTSFVSVTGVTPYIAIVKGLRPTTGANITFSVDDAAKGCRNTAFLPFTVTAAASMVENESNTSSYTTDLNVYPNPTNGMVTIENIGEAKTISLIDVTGRVLKTTPVNADRMRLDYSNITKGNYFISIQGENLKEMKSIVIE